MKELYEILNKTIYDTTRALNVTKHEHCPGDVDGHDDKLHDLEKRLELLKEVRIHIESVL